METIKLPPLPTDADVYNEAQCPSRLILDRIADKWATLIIGILAQSKHRRFNELRRMIGGISQKMLTQTLRDLERDGLVKRTIYPEVPPRVEYELTRLGRTLCGPLGSLTQWAHDHIEEVKRAQADFDAHV
ncbi:MAG: helix-turn-helix transcriptional regulator [Candidatus Eremiobacteraeota bacterium]|nr:helix-turn-helix transcriptional regulator [Candidatus Eremiobacteraeota bacterium]MBV8498352.1 helix-turn-helix transcriptional regulator [Candidatus Eremiobacteraeota bacterium]